MLSDAQARRTVFASGLGFRVVCLHPRVQAGWGGPLRCSPARSRHAGLCWRPPRCVCCAVLSCAVLDCAGLCMLCCCVAFWMLALPSGWTPARTLGCCTPDHTLGLHPQRSPQPAHHRPPTHSAHHRAPPPKKKTSLIVIGRAAPPPSLLQKRRRYDAGWSLEEIGQGFAGGWWWGWAPGGGW